jgi:hypothetical protein
MGSSKPASDAVDGDRDLRRLTVLPGEGGDEGRFDRLEDDLFVDVFVAMNSIDDSQDFFWLHGFLKRTLGRLSCDAVRAD